MANLSPFCTCGHPRCPLYPANHDRGCAPCIEKNLRTRELPNCFFDRIPGGKDRANDSFEEFARLVLGTER